MNSALFKTLLAGDFMARISAANVRRTDQTNAVYTQLRNMLAGHWTTRGRNLDHYKEMANNMITERVDVSITR
jgi:hypothetical protein